MNIYTSAGDYLCEVGRVGAGGVQLVAASIKAIHVWDLDRSSPVQSLPIRITGGKDLLLRTSPDGKRIVGCGHNKMWCWRAGRRGWKSQRVGAGTVCCAARFTAAPATLTQVTLVDLGPGRVQANCIERDLTSAEPWDKSFAIVSAFSLAPTGLTSAVEFYRLPWFATDLSTDGNWFLMSAREKAMHVWHTPDGRHVGTVKLKGISNEAAFSPDGSMFAIDSGTTVYIHRTEDLSPVTTWRIKYSYTPQLAWSPDGRRLARTDNSATVRVFDVADKREVTALRMPRQRGAVAVSYSPDGLTMMVGTVKGNVIVWDVD